VQTTCLLTDGDQVAVFTHVDRIIDQQPSTKFAPTRPFSNSFLPS